jgi:hypothetical protein
VHTFSVPHPNGETIPTPVTTTLRFMKKKIYLLSHIEVLRSHENFNPSY